MTPTKTRLIIDGSFDFERRAFIGRVGNREALLDREDAIRAALRILTIATTFGGLSAADRDAVADILTIRQFASAGGMPR